MKKWHLTCAWALVSTCAVTTGCPPDEHDAGEGEGEGEGEGDACATDAILGSLHVEDGFLLVGGQGIPDNITTVAFQDLGDGSPVKLVGLTDDLHVVDLGDYPGSTPALPPVLFDAVAPDDAGLQRGGDSPGVFPSFLLADRALIATGYTRTGGDFGGFVGALNTSDNASSYVDSPSNFAAVTRGNTLFVEAAGFDSDVDGLGVYAAAAGAVSTFALLGDGNFSGNVAATSEGALVIGRFAGSSNELYALSSSTVDAVLAGTASVDVDSLTPFYTGSLNGFAAGVVGVGAGVALIDIDGTFTGVGASFIGLTDDGASVTAASPVPAITGGSTQCTIVSFLAQTGGDLIVGVRDNAGTRLVQVRKQ